MRGYQMEILYSPQSRSETDSHTGNPSVISASLFTLFFSFLVFAHLQGDMIKTCWKRSATFIFDFSPLRFPFPQRTESLVLPNTLNILFYLFDVFVENVTCLCVSLFLYYPNQLAEHILPNLSSKSSVQMNYLSKVSPNQSKQKLVNITVTYEV